jgi:hypothetical protein
VAERILIIFGVVGDTDPLHHSDNQLQKGCIIFSN